MSLSEIQEIKGNISRLLHENYSLDEESYNLIMDDNRTIHNVRAALKRNKIARPEYIKVIRLVKQDISLNRRIGRLVTMQKLFRYWHVVHMPFALVMLIIMVIHVLVTIVFGYRWIF